MKTEIQMLESQLIYLKLEIAETMNEILKEYNKFLEKYKEYNKFFESYYQAIQEIYDRIELLKKQSQ